jgi:RNA polymerase sigma factor (TIGR02999 family)
MTEPTPILSPIDRPFAAEQLLPLVYDELRQLAAHQLAQERTAQTLQPTALVHEAYLRLLGSDPSPQQRWDGPGHFFAAAAESMRRILIDRARARLSQKRGAGRKRLDVDAIDMAVQAAPDQLLAINEAIDKLAHQDRVAAQLVELRYFAGLNVEESGKALGMSTATAYRHWKYARAWLHGELLGTVAP